MDFRLINTAEQLRKFIAFCHLGQGLILADILRTSDDFIIRIWYTMTPTTTDELLSFDCDFWFVKDNLTQVEWYEFLSVLAQVADNFDDSLIYEIF